MEKYQEADANTVTKIKWGQVTWYSQTLAIVLSVVIFWLGFLIGGMDGKELEAEVSYLKIQLQEVGNSFVTESNELNTIPANYSTWTTIGTHRLKSHLDLRDFSFNNGAFKVEFTYGQFVQLSHKNITPVLGNKNSKGSFDVSAEFSEEQLFWLNVHDKNDAHRQDLFLSPPKVLGNITVGIIEWEILEGTKNGYYDGAQEYLYRTAFGDYVVYLSAGTPVLETEGRANDIVKTLSFELINR